MPDPSAAAARMLWAALVCEWNGYDSSEIEGVSEAVAEVIRKYKEPYGTEDALATLLARPSAGLDAPASPGGVGSRWALIEVWVERPAGKTARPSPIEALFDVVADAAHAWGVEHEIDPYVSGTLNTDAPSWPAPSPVIYQEDE